MLQSDSATLVSMQDAMCLLHRHCEQVAANDFYMSSAAKRLRELRGVLYNKHVNIPAVHAADILCGRNPKDMLLRAQPVGPQLENLQRFAEVSCTTGVTASAVPLLLPNVEGADEDDDGARVRAGAPAGTGHGDDATAGNGSPPARRLRPQLVHRMPTRYCNISSEGDTSDEEGTLGFGVGHDAETVCLTLEEAAAAAISGLTAKNPGAPLPEAGLVGGACGFFSAWGAAYAAQHLRHFFASTPLGAVNQIR